MVFSSNIFLIYFLPIFLIMYYISPKGWRNVVLLLFSLVFYAYGAPDFVLLLVGSCVANFYLVKLMHNSENKLTKKLYCAAAITISLGLLIYYKYAKEKAIPLYELEDVTALHDMYCKRGGNSYVNRLFRQMTEDWKVLSY